MTWYIHVSSSFCLTDDGDLESPLHLHDSFFGRPPDHTGVVSSMAVLHRVQLQLLARVTERRRVNVHRQVFVQLRCETPRELRRQKIGLGNALQLELRVHQEAYVRSRGRDL